MLLTGPISRERFGDIDLNDPFFDSLKADYREFPEWFARKHDNEAWVLREEKRVLAFLYLKEEVGPLDDVAPSRPTARRLKAGTMKVDAQGTRLGERFLRLMFDEALERQVTETYVTVFPKHEGLVKLLMFGVSPSRAPRVRPMESRMSTFVRCPGRDAESTKTTRS